MAQSNLLGFSAAGFVAGGTIPVNTMVKLDTTAGQVVVTTAITEVPFGAAMTSAVSGGTVKVQTHGIAKVTASGIIALGAQVVASTDGKVETFTGIGATAYSCGVALTAAAAAGDVIEVMLATPPVAGPTN